MQAPAGGREHQRVAGSYLSLSMLYLSVESPEEAVLVHVSGLSFFWQSFKTHDSFDYKMPNLTLMYCIISILKKRVYTGN